MKKYTMVFALLIGLISCDSSTDTVLTGNEKAEQKIGDATSALSKRDFTAALSAFLEAAESAEDKAIKANAYSGASYSVIRKKGEDQTNSLNNAYIYVVKALEVDAENANALGLKILLETSFKKNYAEAIIIGNSLLASHSSYAFEYDNSLDYHDVLYDIARSEFALNKFSNCIETLKKLDPDLTIEKNDPDIGVKLMSKIEELRHLYFN